MLSILADPNYAGSSLLMCTRFNLEPNLACNVCDEGHVFRSATPLHLHKCIMQFVSDSWSFLLISAISCHFNFQFFFDLQFYYTAR